MNHIISDKANRQLRMTAHNYNFSPADMKARRSQVQIQPGTHRVSSKPSRATQQECVSEQQKKRRERRQKGGREEEEEKTK